ncbi:siderophore biosynthesis protein [Pseudomonas sp. M47T1]|uniref:GNAT family N-acetyltransferase n=1 Tax=unclassified Pseudomonas TaxID=196821 RepID=UPI0002606866|nr:GNAT family N-acetyltransferase [Pseudomonas sp. M47T1]EIK94910.1 siderophore biosynthesis protein [Pseudomonas sp. M47T1]
MTATDPLLPLPHWCDLVADATDRHVTLSLNGEVLIDLRIECLEVIRATPAGQVSAQGLRAGCYWLLSTYPAYRRVHWQLPVPPEQALLSGLLVTGATPGEYLCERDLFWQLPQPWLAQPTAAYPEHLQVTDGKRHPRRAPKPAGQVYRRFDPRIQAWVSLRTLDIEQDLERFNRWQNTPRVSNFWQEQGDLAQHRAYLEKLAADPHTLTLIGCFDDQPFAYFEAYWAREDRIAPFLDADHYDRGIHMLVGEENHRGPHKVASWLSALTHYLFLDDARTQRVVAEPRADNGKMIGYLQGQGFYREKEFDFPHKRAALMVVGREGFFSQNGLV